jgi:hypothetical protein
MEVIRKFILIGLVIALGCKNEKFDKSDLPNKSLIDSVIVSLITQTSIRFTDKDSVSFVGHRYAIYDTIIGLKVTTYKDFDNSGLDFRNCFLIDWLTKHEDFQINKKFIFNKIDSLFMIYQSNNSKNYKFDNTLFPRALIISKEFIKGKIKDYRDKKINNQLYNDMWWIMIHQPLFSFDKKHAIVAIDANCVWGDCCFGDVFILEKLNNEWIIIKAIRRFEA